MPRTIKAAAIQMAAQPAPTLDRLERARCLVAQAAQAGANLVVLPELFNLGYEYSPTNYERAEPLTGPTVTWLKASAAQYQVHLAGSLLLLSQQDVYNSLLLFAPDGRMWRYDKRYPWAWERAYFRPGHGLTVAQTDLGDIGLLICWDTAHLHLWRQYAGQVDLMLVSSCPPDTTNPTYHFPVGQVGIADLGPVMALTKDKGRVLFGEMINQQTAWLQVPLVHTVGIGPVRTAIPNGLASVLLLLPTAPWLARYLPQAHQLELACECVPGCKVVDANGQVLAELTPADGEAFTLAEVNLPNDKPVPQKPQPHSRLPAVIYLISDGVTPWLMIPRYRQGVRRVWGQQMAPLSPAARRVLWLLGLSLVVGLGLALLLKRLGRR
ncbi:MAG: carbon-nitrogen hydrolase family protein [Anaerolineae bacterium]|nr:carbon-nitrogen hydrolase family protein [Anaerolineae bacterium]